MKPETVSESATPKGRRHGCTPPLRAAGPRVPPAAVARPLAHYAGLRCSWSLVSGLCHVRSPMGKANPTAAPRPRVPALVKREVADSRDGEGAEEDTARLQYRGFDKSKLNASRKQQRKEARQDKKKGKAEHQMYLNP